MKPLAIFLVILVIAAFAGVGYLYFSANLEVSFVECVATDPLTQADYFSSLKTSLETGTFVGTRYSVPDLPDPENCLFYTWTVRVANKTFLQADTVEIQVTPMSGDILSIGTTKETVLPARSETSISATVLTARSMHSVREATVTWYVWGLPFSARITLGR